MDELVNTPLVGAVNVLCGCSECLCISTFSAPFSIYISIMVFLPSSGEGCPTDHGQEFKTVERSRVCAFF